MAQLQYYHDANSGCDGRTYARQGFDVAGYWTENGMEQRPAISKGLGCEIECGTNAGAYEDDNDFVNNYLEPEIRKVFDEGFFKYQRDASIEYEYPVEIISQVFTAGWYNNGGREKLAQLFDGIFAKLNMGQNNSCGNHINISRAMFYNDRSAWLLDEEITNHFNKYCVLFGRKDYESERIDTEYFHKREYAERREGHYTAINWAHWEEGASARLELRIVGKATSGEQYCSYIDLILKLIDECNAKAKAETERERTPYKYRETTFYLNGKKSRKITEYVTAYTGGHCVIEKTYNA